MICVYHSKDLDGWTSAAIVKLRYPDAELIGWTYGQPKPTIKEHEPVIMVDICFSMKEMSNIAQKADWRLTWIDHHISQIKEYRNFIGDGETFMNIFLPKEGENVAACELTWRCLYPDTLMPEAIRLIGRYDCFGHKGTDEEQRVLFFQYAARAKVTNPEEAAEFLDMPFDKLLEMILRGKVIYKYLCVEAKQKYAQKFDIDFDGYKFACINAERFNPVNFGIDYHKEGYDGFACFWFENGQWIYSLYNDNGKVDCSEICKKRGGGGHRGAAGFQTNNCQPPIY
jgi:oligoribonuclease NrnB/cAMP/cGMP phosphodiesterase (DHH superfamily)